MLRRIWSLPDNSIPDVHEMGWHDVIPNNFRAVCLTVEHPVPVTERRKNEFASHAPLQQLLLYGKALLKAVYHQDLHFSLSGNRYMWASGTTILLVEKRKDGEIIGCPWSASESTRVALRRLILMRKHPAPRLNPQELYVMHHMLPRPQAAISVVGHLGIENPGTNILASGGECPIAITVGRDTIHFVLDHRIYDPDTAALLYSRFFRFCAIGKEDDSRSLTLEAH